MNDDSNYWFNLPSNLISKIGSYSSKEYKLELRLINKHWSQRMNKLVFCTINGRYSPELDHILANYGHLINKVITLDRSRIEIANRILSKAKHISTLGIWLGYSSHADYLKSLLSASNQIKTLIIEDTERNDTGLRYRYDWKSLSYVIKNYQYPLSLTINLMCGYLQPIFDNLQFELLVELKLDIYSCQLESCSKAISKGKQLKRLSLKIRDVSENYGEFHLTKFLSLKDLVTRNLEYFKLTITEYLDDCIGTFQRLLRNELLSLFTSSSSILTLKSFEFKFVYGDVDLITNLFISQIPVTNCKWLKLTKLKLFEVDSYLMGHIIEQCPNLKELVFDSALVLPFNATLDNPKQFNYLTRLSFRGFQTDLTDNKRLVKLLFSNVVTLSLQLSYIDSNSIIMDAYCIPMMFPNLTKVIISSDVYNLMGLIYQTKYLLNWKELYIEVGGFNKQLIKPLTAKLLNLEFLYIGGVKIFDFNFDFELDARRFKLLRASLEEFDEFKITVDDKL